MEELIQLCVEKDISVEISYEKLVESLKFVFSKDNRRYGRLVPIWEIQRIDFQKTFISQLVKEAESNLTTN